MTTLRYYLELKLDVPGDLERYVNDKRGAGWSWQQIADEIHRATDIFVSRETLRLWFPEDVTPLYTCSHRESRCERRVEQDGDYCPEHDLQEPDWDAIRKDRIIDSRV